MGRWWKIYRSREYVDLTTFYIRNIKMIKSMGMGFINGQIIVDILESGLMVKNSYFSK